MACFFFQGGEAVAKEMAKLKYISKTGAEKSIGPAIARVVTELYT